MFQSPAFPLLASTTQWLAIAHVPFTASLPGILLIRCTFAETASHLKASTPENSVAYVVTAKFFFDEYGIPVERSNSLPWRIR